MVIGPFPNLKTAVADSLIRDLTDTKHKGYGMGSNSWDIFLDSDSDYDTSLKKYVKQFDIDEDPEIFTMELDMTQTESQYGILKYIFHNKPKQSVEEIRNDGEYIEMIK